MKCPQCSAPNAPKVTHCASCGFSSERLRRSLGDQWVRLERITDAAHCLRLEDYQRCEVEMDDFERLLPRSQAHATSMLAPVKSLMQMDKEHFAFF